MEMALSALLLVTRTGVLTGQMGKGLKSIWRYTIRRTLILATSELAACGYNHTIRGERGDFYSRISTDGVRLIA